MAAYLIGCKYHQLMPIYQQGSLEVTEKIKTIAVHCAVKREPTVLVTTGDQVHVNYQDV